MPGLAIGVGIGWLRRLFGLPAPVPTAWDDTLTWNDNAIWSDAA